MYNRVFRQVVQKEGESEIKYIKRFQNTKALEISVGNSYTEYQLMHTLLENLQQVGKYSAQIEIYQAQMRREEKFIDQKLLSISDLQIDYLNLDNLVGNNDRENFAQSRCSHCGG